DEIGVLELDARTLLPIVDQHVEPRGFEVMCDPVGRLALCWLVDVDRDDLRGERRQGRGPHDPRRVVVLFDRGRDSSGDTNTVATHFDGTRFTIRTEKGGAHGDRVLRA